MKSSISSRIPVFAEEHYGVGGNLVSSLNNGSMMAYTTVVITV